MNCADWERLLDAYLDRQLTGALRLEFDAHRLGCRRCQDTLSMMEACEHVIAGDKPPVMLSEDFTDQVMAHIGATRVQRTHVLRSRWVMRVAATALPAAAVILLAVYWPGGRGDTPNGTPVVHGAPKTAAEFAAVTGADPREPGIDEVERLDRGHELIADVIAQRLRESMAAGKSLSSETIRMAQYLNIDLPSDVVRQKVDFATVNPIGGIFFQMFAPPASDSSESEPAEPADATRI